MSSSGVVLPNRRSGVNHENVAASSHPFPSLAPTVSVWASSLSLIFAYLVAGLATLVAGSVIAALQEAAVAVPAMVPAPSVRERARRCVSLPVCLGLVIQAPLTPAYVSDGFVGVAGWWSCAPQNTATHTASRHVPAMPFPRMMIDDTYLGIIPIFCVARPRKLMLQTGRSWLPPCRKQVVIAMGTWT